MLRKVALGLVGLGMMVSGAAMAASSVSNSGSGQAQAVTSQSAVQASSQAAAIIGGAISNAIGGGAGGGFSGLATGNSTSYLNSRDTGRNAGAVDKPFGIWLQGAYSSLDNSQLGAAADGDIINTVVGFDYKLNDRLVIGIAGLYETIDIDTNTLSGRGNIQNDGFGINPYIGFQLTPQWNASLSGSYSWLSYDSKRNNNSITGSYDATRWTVNAALNGNYGQGAIRLLPQIGVLYLEEEADGFTESNGQANASNTIKLGRLYAGGKVGYAMGTWMPYVKLIGEYDFEHPDALAIGNGTFTNDDDVGGKIGLGADFFSAGPVSGSIEGSYDSLGRTDLDVWTLTGRIRVRF